MVETLDKEGLAEEDKLKEKYEDKFKEISNEYKQLGKILCKDLKNLLEDGNIDVSNVTYRIKTLDSFLEKISRKAYNDPLNEIEDICGLRIVCYYNSDLDKITSIVNDEFNVLDYEDKSKLLDVDKFGYISRHFIVKLKEDWLKTPRYRDLGHLKAEIQLSTVFDAYVGQFSHEHVYKKKEQIPTELIRKLYELSAILENTGKQFDTLRKDIKKSKKNNS